MKRILFVCLGNICRSPLAEGIARKRIEEFGYALEVDSAGTGSWHIGEKPCDRSVAIADRFGVDISTLRARQVATEDRSRFDMVVAMDETNKRDLLSMGFDKVVKLGDFGELEGVDIPDPYYFDGDDGFEEIYRMIENAVTELLERINDANEG